MTLNKNNITTEEIMKTFRQHLEESKLTAYKITYDDGSTSSTNMAAGVTLDDAKKYFIGKTFTDEDHKGKETKRKAVKVELIESN
jgi:hypothetical protein